MQIVIVGSGPVGMAAALLLARQGHRLMLVDRDPGPVVGRPWTRVGVMQFHLPHGFRSQCVRLLADRLPDVLQAVLDAGGVVVAPADAPESAAMLHIRRSVFERAVWDMASAEPGVERLTGHADSIEIVDQHAIGVTVDSTFVDADLVVDASGRADRLTAAVRPGGQRVDCGMAYAARQYRLHPGADPGPMNGGPAFLAHHPGYLVAVFAHEQGTFTVLIVRPNADRTLAELRHADAFEAACRVVPGLAEWTDPRRSGPIDVVRAGAGLTNTYRPQPADVGGLVAIGDAACTTNPQGARGIPLGLQSAAALADLVRDDPVERLAVGLDRWASAHLLPWYRDHVAWDASLLGLWSGQPVTPDGAIGPEVLVAAAHERHPEWMATLVRYFGMETDPTTLEPLRASVRQLVRQGWQPRPPDGPSRDELAAVVGADLAEPVPA